MHAHRTRLAVAAAALATTASLVTAAPSSAAPSSAAPASVASSSAEPAVAARGGEQRFISIRGIEPRPNRFFIKGKVRPSYESRRAIIQRRVGRAGRWRTWNTFRTTERSGYRERIRALPRPGRVFYRVKIDASGDFARSFSGVVVIRTFRA